MEKKLAGNLWKFWGPLLFSMFQILGAKKQKEFVPCRTLFMRGIFRIYSEFLKLRVRQHFSISSGRLNGDVHLSPIFQRWQASYSGGIHRRSYGWNKHTLEPSPESFPYSVHLEHYSDTRRLSSIESGWEWRLWKEPIWSCCQGKSHIRAPSCLPAFSQISSVCIEKFKFSST